MTSFRNTVIGLYLGALSVSALAQSNDEHKEHHPADKVAKEVANPAPVQSAENKMADMEQHMKAMKTMHDKMMSAKTPEERQTLMAEHKKTMQQSMRMMQDAGAMANPNIQPEERLMMMEKRMDMMQSMLQMMMNCPPQTPTP